VAAARKAFPSWSLASREERLDMLQAIAGGLDKGIIGYDVDHAVEIANDTDLQGEKPA
jgi:hypothetical protein